MEPITAEPTRPKLPLEAINLYNLFIHGDIPSLVRRGNSATVHVFSEVEFGMALGVFGRAARVQHRDH